jgi:RNA polymerase sigma-70 factor (ECF subfamily)
VQEAARFPDADLSSQRELVGVFLGACREGGFEALTLILEDPDVVLRADSGAVRASGSRLVRGASAVARQSMTFSRSAGDDARPTLVNRAASARCRVSSALERP